MKVACYLRVSTTDQTVASQRSELVAWLVSHQMSEDSVVWYEDSETGKTLARPAMRKLRADVESGEVQTVIIQRLDRLSRNLIEGLNLLANWAELGVRIVAVKQNVDMSGPFGRLVAAIFLGLAEMELELRRERQRAGIELARKTGKYIGRKPGSTKAAPERAWELRAKGATVLEIAGLLGVSVSCVRGYLKRWKGGEFRSLPRPAEGSSTQPVSPNVSAGSRETANRVRPQAARHDS